MWFVLSWEGIYRVCLFLWIISYVVGFVEEYCMYLCRYNDEFCCIVEEIEAWRYVVVVEI